MPKFLCISYEQSENEKIDAELKRKSFELSPVTSKQASFNNLKTNNYEEVRLESSEFVSNLHKNKRPCLKLDVNLDDYKLNDYLNFNKKQLAIINNYNKADEDLTQLSFLTQKSCSLSTNSANNELNEDESTSPSYSPLESPIRFNYDTQSQSSIGAHYLDIFEQCVYSVDFIIEIIDCMNDVCTQVERNAAESPRTSQKIDYNQYTSENFDELNAYFLLKKLDFSENKVDKIQNQLITLNFHDNELEYLEKVFKSYLNKINSNCYSHEQAKILLNNELKASKIDCNNRDFDVISVNVSNLLLINTCFMSIDLLFNASYASIIWFFNTLINNYQQLIDTEELKTLNGIMDDVKKIANGDKQHFKLKNLCNFIKKLHDSHKNVKILIVVSRSIPVLFEDIRNAINRETKIKAKIIDKSKNINENDACKCYIISNDIDENRLSDYLRNSSNLIEFEKQLDENLSKNAKDWSTICAKHSIKYNYYEKFKFIVEKNEIKAECNVKNTEKELNLCIVVSSDIAENSELVDLLETKLKCTLFERDYEYIMRKYKLKYELFYADLLLNASTGIIIECLDEICHSFDKFIKRLNRLKYQLEHCFVIIKCTIDDINGSYMEFTKKISSYLLKCVKIIKIKILFAFNQDDLSELIVKILDNYVNNAYLIELSIDASVHELYLLTFGCFNSYSAQYLLNKYTLDQLFDLNYEQLLDNYSSVIPNRVLDFFHKLVNQQPTSK